MDKMHKLLIGVAGIAVLIIPGAIPAVVLFKLYRTFISQMESAPCLKC